MFWLVLKRNKTNTSWVNGSRAVLAPTRYFKNLHLLFFFFNDLCLIIRWWHLAVGCGLCVEYCCLAYGWCCSSSNLVWRCSARGQAPSPGCRQFYARYSAGIHMDECELLVLWFEASESLPFFVPSCELLLLIFVSYGRTVSNRTGKWKHGYAFLVWGVWNATFSAGPGVKSSSICRTHWGKSMCKS